MREVGPLRRCFTLGSRMCSVPSNRKCNTGSRHLGAVQCEGAVVRLSVARAHTDGHGRGPTHRAESRNESAPGYGAAVRRMALGLSVVLLLGAIGLLFSPAKSAGASGTTATTVTQSGQVFASVGNSTVNIYDPSSGNLLNALVDNTREPYTAGSAWDANGNFYVTDDTNGTISEYSPSGAPLPTFASGLTNPLSLTFDNAGNLYVGQQTTPYIAVFSPSGQRLPDIGPVATQLYGVDWIDLASNECTFYYTTEG